METYFYANKEEKIIKADLLDQTANEFARSFSKPLKEGYKTKREVLTQTQLRRYFNECRNLEKKVKQTSFDRSKPLIKMVKSKVAYSFEKIPPSFEEFLNKSIDEIKDSNDFEAFMLHFEAVVGFSKQYLKK